MDTVQNLLSMNKITKTFPGVVAVDNVDFDVRYGEVHALVGENGAGKSTLIKILGGVYELEGGTILFDNEEVFFTSTHQSLVSGISIIYQEFNLIPDLSVAENIYIGREPKRIAKRFINWKQINSDAQEVLDRLEAQIDPKKYVSDLTVAERQMVEIAKALSIRSKLIIMDEPTATLTEREVKKLFEIITGLRQEGVSIIYISHRLEEAFELADRITVLRDGRKIGTKVSSETSEGEVIEMMVGKVVKDYFAGEIKEQEKRELIMEVKNYSIADHIEDISFGLYRGEILGFAGVIGSGVHHLLKSLYGVEQKKEGKVFFEGEPVEIRSSRDAIKLGFGYVTEDRKNAGVLPDMTVLHNITIIIIKLLTFLRGMFIKNSREKEKFNEINKSLNIKFADYGQKIIYLSGGNQQKVVIGRTLVTNCKVLILQEPTRGIDVGAKAEIHRIMRDLANRGISIIMTSSELPELVNLPDRCIVLYKGEIAAEFNRDNMDEEKLVAAQIGHAVE
jgi:ABC-type sugar transport system ATPase subunit